MWKEGAKPLGQPQGTPSNKLPKINPGYLYYYEAGVIVHE